MEPLPKFLCPTSNAVTRPIVEPLHVSWKNTIKNCAFSSNGVKSLHRFDYTVLGIVTTRAVESESRSRKDFQPEESEGFSTWGVGVAENFNDSDPGRLFAHQLWLFVPQTCVSVTLGNLSSLTLQQEMIMAIQKGCSALICIPSLRGRSRSAASLGLITQPTLCEFNRSGLVSLKFPFAHSG